MMAEEPQKEIRRVGEFIGIEAMKGVNVSIVQNSNGRDEIEVMTDGCDLDLVETVVKNHKLRVSMKKRPSGAAVQVVVYCKDIESALVKTGASFSTDCTFEHKGKFLLDVAAKCEVEMDIECDELEVSANSCMIKLEGKATKQDVEISGTVADSKYDAGRLKSEEIDIFASGANSIVNASRRIFAEADGCTIECLGEAEVVKKETSGGQIVKK